GAGDCAGEEQAGVAGEVLEDGARLEERERRATAVRLVVDDRRHAVVGADAQEIRLELLAASEVDGDGAIREPALLEHDAGLPAVRCRPIVEIDHRAAILLVWSRRWKVPPGVQCSDT